MPIVLDDGAYIYGETTIPLLYASASVNGECRVLITIVNLALNAGQT